MERVTPLLDCLTKCHQWLGVCNSAENTMFNINIFPTAMESRGTPNSGAFYHKEIKHLVENDLRGKHLPKLNVREEEA